MSRLTIYLLSDWLWKLHTELVATLYRDVHSSNNTKNRRCATKGHQQKDILPTLEQPVHAQAEKLEVPVEQLKACHTARKPFTLHCNSWMELAGITGNSTATAASCPQQPRLDRVRRATTQTLHDQSTVLGVCFANAYVMFFLRRMHQDKRPEQDGYVVVNSQHIEPTWQRIVD